ncbi:MAG TPA: hypothetical protein VEB59_09945 [Gemmatimonadales bacterium]|nr:hypothetical protein [Gemmatimonadales bacterium]
MSLRLRHAAVALSIVVTACGEDPSGPALPDEQATASAVAAPAFVQVSGGAGHSCGLSAAGAAWCWGHNEAGQLGTSDLSSRLLPAPVTGSHTFRQISAGGTYTCAIATDDRVWCWGGNFNGQLGDGTVERRTAPTAVATTLRFQSVSTGSGSEHTCAIGTDRLAYCWGAGYDGELGDGTRGFRTVPGPVSGDRHWRQISAGYTHTCGITAGRVLLCWGADDEGQLGDGPDLLRKVRPKRVAGGRLYDRVSAGILRSCAVSTEGQAFCWGAGELGQIGDGGMVSRSVPTKVAGTRSWRNISAVGTNHTCAETSVGKVLCWGINDYGALGDGTTDSHARPAAVSGAFTFIQMASGVDQTCAVVASGAAYCWGSNEGGQVGDGTSRNIRTAPTRVGGS